MAPRDRGARELLDVGIGTIANVNTVVKTDAKMVYGDTWGPQGPGLTTMRFA